MFFNLEEVERIKKTMDVNSQMNQIPMSEAYRPYIITCYCLSEERREDASYAILIALC